MIYLAWDMLKRKFVQLLLDCNGTLDFLLVPVKISSGKDQRTRIVTATQKGLSAVAKALPLWNEVQAKVKQQMGENSWRELMQNLGHFVTVADQLIDQN
jgi:hypothetical protein